MIFTCEGGPYRDLVISGFIFQRSVAMDMILCLRVQSTSDSYPTSLGFGPHVFLARRSDDESHIDSLLGTYTDWTKTFTRT